MLAELEYEMGSAILNPVDILRVSIGDIHVAIMSDDPGMKVGVPKATERFLLDSVNHDEASATVTAAWGDLREPVAGDRVFDSGRLWQLYRQGADYIFRFHSPIFGEHPYKQARFHEDFTSGEVTLHADYHNRGEVALPLEYPLDELMMTNLLARGRGIEVHACGMRDLDGRGYLFVGHSGAGKTTSAQLWEKAGVLILSDDRVILRYLDGRVWMYGTPWHGEAELATSARTELTQIFFLGRGVRNEMVPLREREAVAQLFTRSFVPFYHPAGLDYSLKLLQQVARAVPCAELHFVPDERVVEFVRENAK